MKPRRILGQHGLVGKGVDEYAAALRDVPCTAVRRECAHGRMPGKSLHRAQLALLPRQFQHGQRRGQLRRAGAHQRFVSKNAARAHLYDGLEVVIHQPLLQQTVQHAAALHQIGVTPVCLAVEFRKFALAAVLHLVHGEIRIAHQLVEPVAVRRIPSHAAGSPHRLAHAVGQRKRSPRHTLAQQGDLPAHFFLCVITVKQHEELIAGHACHKAAFPVGAGKARGHTADIGVAHIVAVGIVDILQVVQIQHHQRTHARRLRPSGQQRQRHTFECAAVIKLGEHVVVTLVFHAFQRHPVTGDVLGQARPAGTAAQQAHTHPAHAVRLRHAENVFRMLVVGFFPFRHIDVQGIHRSLEGLWAAHGARQLRTAEYVEKLVGEEQRAVPAVHLKTAHAHAGHLQDLGELAARAQHFVAERLDGARQCVQLCDIRFLQAGGSRRVRRAHFGRQLDDGLRNRTYGDQDRHQTGENDGCQQRQHNQQRIVLECEQRAARHRPQQNPLIVCKRRVRIVQAQHGGADVHLLAAAPLQRVKACALLFQIHGAEPGSRQIDRTAHHLRPDGCFRVGRAAHAQDVSAAVIL